LLTTANSSEARNVRSRWIFLKLVAIHERYPEAQLLVALTGHEAAASLAGWVRFVAESNGIRIEPIELGREWAQTLDAARAKQTRGIQQIKRA
jgi:hypothetical protein